MKKVRNKVGEILKKYPRARNSDNFLIARYIWEEGMYCITDLVHSDICIETIRRSRQWFQARGMYKANKEVRKKRNKRQKSFKATFKSSNPIKLTKKEKEELIKEPILELNPHCCGMCE